MWSRGSLLYINVSVPNIRWLKIVLPVFIVTEIVHGLVDLFTLGVLITPDVKLTKKGATVSNCLNGLKVAESFFEHLYLVEGDFVNVHVGKDNVDIIIKVI